MQTDCGHPILKECSQISDVFARLVVHAGERMLDSLMVVLSKLLRPKLVSQVIDCPGKAERQLVTVVNGRASIDPDVEGLIYGHKERNRVLHSLAGQSLCHPPTTRRCRSCLSRVRHI